MHSALKWVFFRFQFNFFSLSIGILVFQQKYLKFYLPTPRDYDLACILIRYIKIGIRSLNI